MATLTLEQRYAAQVSTERPKVVLNGITYDAALVRSVVWAGARTNKSLRETNKLIVWTKTDVRHVVYQSECDPETRYWLAEVAFPDED